MNFFTTACLLVLLKKCHAGSPACGTFAPYTPSADPSQPAKDGFVAGKALDGSTMYVGRGASRCNYQPFMPARISTVSTFSGAGAYMTCGGRYSFDNRDAHYLLDHPGLRWVPTSRQAMDRVPGRIVIAGPFFSYYVGRVSADLSNRTRYTEVSKVHFDAGAFGMWYMRPNGSSFVETYTDRDFEILACGNGSSTGTRVNATYLPKTQTLDALLPKEMTGLSKNFAKTRDETSKPESMTNCAFWMSYRNDKAPTINGFSAGIGLKNTTAYIGRGSYQFQVQPGRLQITQPSGLYVAWANGEQSALEDVEYLAVVRNCTCSWMRPKSAIARAGLVAITDTRFTFLVGRKVWPDGKVSVTKVDYFTTTQWYTDARGVPVVDQASEVLVCESRNVSSNRPALAFGNEACAGWMAYMSPEAAARSGYSIGTDLSGEPYFVGRVNGVPGRVRSTPPALYYANADGNLTTSVFVEFLVLPRGCTCKWTPLPDALDHKGLVSALTSPDAVLVGRMPLADHKVALLSVYKSMLLAWYRDAGGKMVEAEADEALVCENRLVKPAFSGLNAKPCALWMEYNNNNVPATSGFSAGQSLANTTAWIGRAFFAGQNMPGRIQVEAPSGVHVPWNGRENLVTTKTEFLALPEGCACQWTSVEEDALRRPGLVEVVDENFHHLVGRVVWPDGRVSVSKVVQPQLVQWFVDVRGSERSSLATEVLVCETNRTADARPVLQFADEACDTWTTFEMNEAPAKNGFAFGSSRRNTTAYVGRGWFNGQFAPGRIQVERKKGLFVENDFGERFVFQSIEYLVVAEGCACSWTPLPDALLHNGLVVVPDFRETFYVGRKWLRSGGVEVAKVESSTLIAWYVDDEGNTVEGTADNVLVCESATRRRVASEVVPFRACGLWMDYNAARAPQTNGFSAGESAKRVNAWVGRGIYASQFAPGRIQVTRPTGLHVAWSDGEKLVKGKVEYVVVPKDCSCSWMKPNVALKRPGLMRAPDFLMRHLVGRKTFDDGLVTVGKVAERSLVLWYMRNRTVEATEQATELLVCETSELSRQRPVVAFTAKKSCAAWAAYNLDDAPATDGFAAGTSWRNTTAYVGRGWFRSQFAPGRLQIESPKGVYLEHTNVERYVVSQTEYLVVPERCRCEWLSADETEGMAGVVTVPSPEFEFLVGRVQLGEDAVAIAKVDSDFLLAWYIDGNGETVEDEASEVLVCQRTG